MDRFTEESMQIMDLPEEVLDLIFDYLPVSDLKNISLVCLHWSIVAFSSRRMHRVCLKVCFRSAIVTEYSKSYVAEDYLTVLRGSKRQHRHIESDVNCQEIAGVSSFIQLLQIFKGSVESLKLITSFMEYSHFRDFLLVVPNLKILSFQNYQPAKAANSMQSPIKPLQHLTDLRCVNDTGMDWKTFDIRTIAPNLKRLDMDCNSRRALEVFKHFSDQLRSVEVLRFRKKPILLLFCEINFPELLEIDFSCDDKKFRDDVVVRTISTFFARLKRLQRVALWCYVAQPMVNVLVENCRDITSLHMETTNLGNRSLIGLVNLTKLKVLKLDGWLKCNVFEDCKPIPSLQELCLICRKVDFDTLEFFTPLPTLLPNLRRLKVYRIKMDDSCLHFICKNMVSIQQLLLGNFQITENGFKFLNRLPHLFELSLGYSDLPHGFFEMIPSNEINLLSFTNCDKMTDDDLMLIPHAFPSLQRLEIGLCQLITIAGIEELRSKMPRCTVSEYEYCDVHFLS